MYVGVDSRFSYTILSDINQADILSKEMTMYAANLLTVFFKVLTELRNAERQGDEETKQYALMELIDMWLLCDHALIIRRCEAILREYGLEAEMQARAAEWAQ